MTGSELAVSVDEGVAVLTLDRPSARNALSQSLIRQLTSALATLGARDDVGAAVLTGSGSAFSAGVDLKELEADPQVGRSVGPRSSPIITSTVPVVAAVNGPAYTGGLELVLACHFAIASERATFADTHARLGMTPGWGMTVLLPEAVGVRRARQLCLSGAPIDAATALTWGLINEVVPHDRLLDRAVEVARLVAAADRGAVRAVDGVLAQTRANDEAGAWSREAAAFRDPVVRTPNQATGAHHAQ